MPQKTKINQEARAGTSRNIFDESKGRLYGSTAQEMLFRSLEVDIDVLMMSDRTPNIYHVAGCVTSDVVRIFFQC